MTKTTPRPKTRKQPWFAPRQIYLRTGQDSSYVEISTGLQIAVAAGFGLFSLWLAVASYGAVSHVVNEGEQQSLVSQLELTEGRLVTISEEASKIPTLEAALAETRSALADAQSIDETAALSAELEQTKEQLETLHQQLSEAKAEGATLEAKLDAKSATGDQADQLPTEEASSLHAQLEDAFVEIEDLEKARDESDSRVAALTAEITERKESAQRNAALLEAATMEIERLQAAADEVDRSRRDLAADQDQTIRRLEVSLDEERAAKDALQQEVDALSSELAKLTTQTVEREASALEADADYHAKAIATELEEVDLLQTIDDLRLDLADQREDSETAVETLQSELALAKTEMETLLKNTLAQAEQETQDAKVEDGDEPPAAPAAPTDQIEEIDRLTTELATAKGDIIKLKSDVRAAKKRLADQASQQTVTREIKPDNTAKLEQQLASNKARIQQLNKALADAKLREVAIDLALINVIPSPSPPAPR